MSLCECHLPGFCRDFKASLLSSPLSLSSILPPYISLFLPFLSLPAVRTFFFFLRLISRIRMTSKLNFLVGCWMSVVRGQSCPWGWAGWSSAQRVTSWTTWDLLTWRLCLQKGKLRMRGPQGFVLGTELHLLALGLVLFWQRNHRERWFPLSLIIWHWCLERSLISVLADFRK